MKLGIIGTRGIPNHYGGFEQCAEYLGAALVRRGHEVTVYSTHNHPYQQPSFEGIRLIHKYNPEVKLGTFGQFFYDLSCIRDARQRGYDIILQLGYNSSSVWASWLPKQALILTNMDGLEWKRTKFSVPVRRFLKLAERLAVRGSDYLVADSKGIQQYLQQAYRADSTYIPYGANPFTTPNEAALEAYGVVPNQYSLLVARLERENSLETILAGYTASATPEPLLVVGRHTTPYGALLKARFTDPRIRFLGGIYAIEALNQLRYHCRLYFHGHTVGGTNPSLLEAMASSALIVAQDNIFNKSILEGDAYYFTTPATVTHWVDRVQRGPAEQGMVQRNFAKVEQLYSWPHIIDQYEAWMLGCLQQGKRR